MINCVLISLSLCKSYVCVFFIQKWQFISCISNGDWKNIANKTIVDKCKEVGNQYVRIKFFKWMAFYRHDLIWYTISDRLFFSFSRLFDCSLNYYEHNFSFLFLIFHHQPFHLISFHCDSVNWFTALNSYHSILSYHSALPSTFCAWDINIHFNGRIYACFIFLLRLCRHSFISVFDLAGSAITCRNCTIKSMYLADN